MTPENFLNILKGDKQAMSGIGSGKVIDRCMHFNGIFVLFKNDSILAKPE